MKQDGQKEVVRMPPLSLFQPPSTRSFPCSIHLFYDRIKVIGIGQPQTFSAKLKFFFLLEYVCELLSIIKQDMTCMFHLEFSRNKNLLSVSDASRYRLAQVSSFYDKIRPTRATPSAALLSVFGLCGVNANGT